MTVNKEHIAGWTSDQIIYRIKWKASDTYNKYCLKHEVIFKRVLKTEQNPTPDAHCIFARCRSCKSINTSNTWLISGPLGNVGIEYHW